MATDKTEVPSGTVVGIALLVIGTLVGVQYGITGYYHSMYGEEQQRKVLGVESSILQRAREQENQRLSRVSEGMRQVAGSFGNGSRPEVIAPRASNDLQALQGWQLQPRVVPNPPPAQGQLPAGADTTAPAPSAAAPAPAAAAPAAPAAPSAPAAGAHG